MKHIVRYRFNPSDRWKTKCSVTSRPEAMGIMHEFLLEENGPTFYLEVECLRCRRDTMCSERIAHYVYNNLRPAERRR